MKWPDLFNDFLNFHQTSAGIAQRLFLVDCLIGNTESTFRLKLIIVALLPLVAIMVISLFWLLVKLCKGTEMVLYKMFGSLLIVVFLDHPSITTTVF